MISNARRRAAVILIAGLLGSLGCNEAEVAVITEANVDEAARAATAAASEAFYAARVAETIHMQSPRFASVGGQNAVIISGGHLVFNTESPYDDEACFESGQSEAGRLWYDLADCQFDGCWADGLAWRDDGVDSGSSLHGFVFDDLVVDCGGQPQIHVDGLGARCQSWSSLDCTVAPSTIRPSPTRVDSIGIREYTSPGYEPPLRLRYALAGEVAAPGVGRIAFETDLLPPSFEGCPAMVPSSGQLLLRGGAGSGATVTYRGCDRYEACLDGPESEAEVCSVRSW